jgi:hypothetical protein
MARNDELEYNSLVVSYVCKHEDEIIQEVDKCMADPSRRAVQGVVCGRSLAGIVGSNLAGGMDVCLL